MHSAFAVNEMTAGGVERVVCAPPVNQDQRRNLVLDTQRPKGQSIEDVTRKIDLYEQDVAEVKARMQDPALPADEVTLLRTRLTFIERRLRWYRGRAAQRARGQL